jgi:chorismate synthase
LVFEGRRNVIAPFNFRTAGETHGPALVALVEGMPAGVTVRASDINRELARRQVGYGRGGRMKIERDEVELLSGIRFEKSLGGPVAMMVRNLDWPNWTERMAQAGERGQVPSLLTARPGHADLPGFLKHGHDDIRNVLERASARETAARVMAGALAKRLLDTVGIRVAGQVLSVGKAKVSAEFEGDISRALASEDSEMRMADPAAERMAMRVVDRAIKDGTSVGGVVEVIAAGVPPGLGSFVSWDRRLDARLAHAVMSIQAVKGVEIGDGMAAAGLPGSAVHDEIFRGSRRGNPLLGGFLLPFHRKTNRAGGVEGGMSNGEPVVVRAAMKPIPTQSNALRTVTVGDWKATSAHKERSDVCAVPACSVVAEAMVAVVLADVLLEKFGGDSVAEIQYNYRGYLDSIGGKRP